MEIYKYIITMKNGKKKLSRKLEWATAQIVFYENENCIAIQDFVLQ